MEIKKKRIKKIKTHTQTSAMLLPVFVKVRSTAKVLVPIGFHTNDQQTDKHKSRPRTEHCKYVCM